MFIQIFFRDDQFLFRHWPIVFHERKFIFKNQIDFVIFFRCENSLFAFFWLKISISLWYVFEILRFRFSIKYSNFDCMNFSWSFDWIVLKMTTFIFFEYWRSFFLNLPFEYMQYIWWFDLFNNSKNRVKMNVWMFMFFDFFFDAFQSCYQFDFRFRFKIVVFWNFDEFFRIFVLR